ncbi:phage tail protein [Mangrovicoccus algicola]|uniref:Phage tail protein n=1 Tax=Mangrovicoccus algicola TaxID=2771008 RepID=A0A8J6YXN5_9RHOB|nr:phage tail protein [Mangrovicoccus algicola]MBE3638374.1 hypothetical protein [Mangrovicoccus algicola]
MAEPRPTVPAFLRLDPVSGWRLAPGALRPGVPDAAGPLRLSAGGTDPVPLAEPFGTFGGRTLPRGLAISGEGRIFLADPGARVIRSALAGAMGPDTGGDWPFAPLWPARDLPAPPDPRDPGPAAPPADPYTLVAPADLALAPNGDLVVADPGAGRVLVMAWPSGQLRHVIAVAALAVAFDAAGRAYLADGVTVHRFDRFWRRDPGFPHRMAGFARPWALAAPCGCAGHRDCACECGTAAGPAAVMHVLDDRQLVSLGETGRVLKADPLSVATAPLRRQGDMLSWDDPARPGQEPLRLPGLRLTGDGRHEGTGLPLMAVARRVALPRRGRILTSALDGGRPGFAWDRLGLEASLPERTRLVVETLTSDSEIETDRLDSLPEGAWSVPIGLAPGDLPELLVQSPPGRYLWLRIGMFGDGRASPEIAAIELFGPRRSGLSRLPAPFHQDPESAHFLDRFLGYFDTVLAELGHLHREMAAHLDPIAVPAGFLDWLGSWFDQEFAAHLPEPVRREMIAGAMAHFRRRGTVAGLREILQWHLGLDEPMPQVIEHFRLPAGPVPIGGTALEPVPPAHAVTIVLPAHAVADPAALARVERLVAASVPAHVRAALRPVGPGVTVARQSTIGVDTLIGPPAAPGLGAAGESFITAGPAGPDMTTGAAAVPRRCQSC